MAVESVSVKEVLRGLTSMSQQILKVQSSLNLNDKDSRRLHLNQLDHVVSGYWILYNTLIYGRTNAQARAAIHSSNHPKPELVLDHVTRLGFITKFFFGIDALFQDLLHALDEPVRIGFYKNARRLVEATNMTSSVTNLEVLKVGASIRNSQHSSGIHTHTTFSKAMQGTDFEFVEGQFCECAGWRHVLIACEEAVTVVEEILRTPEVLGVPFVEIHKLKIPL